MARATFESVQMAGNETAPTPQPARFDRWAALRGAGFRNYWIASLGSRFSVQVQTVAVAWQVYDLTRDPLYLGLVGLTQFLPSLMFVLFTGAVADRYSRRTVMVLCMLVEALAAAGLLWLGLSAEPPVVIILAILLVLGTARAFLNPARQAIVPNLVRPADLANAISLNSTGVQFATIAGPVLGGLLYGLGPAAAYGGALLLSLGGVWFGLRLGTIAQLGAEAGQSAWRMLGAGFHYIWREKIVLGAISLDLFAVLLGGATALLPVYARDILDIGPVGLGILRSAPAVGAIVVGFWLMSRPVRRNAGLAMFAAVAFFGLFTLVFALSKVVWLSALALALMGGCDMLSVYVRNTLIQLWTPDALRGRVNAVNQLFIGTSNELGAFRAGGAAALIGAVPAVVIGGIGTLAVAGLWARWFPDLRRVQHLDRAE